MKVLVKLETNWADEFSVEGFKVFDSEQHWLDHYKENIEDQDWYFGTNEGFEQGELTEDDFTVTPISEETYAALSLTLGCTFGHFPG